MKNITTASVFKSKQEWVEKFFRFGLIAKGIVYCLLGFLTIMAALGLGGKKATKSDTLNFIYDQPFGKILLFIVAIGLLAFATLRVFQCYKDIDNKGNNAAGVLTRIGYGISALIYMLLGLYAAKIALVGSAGNGSNSKKFIVSKILEIPAGHWIIALVALIIIISGGYQIFKGVSRKFMKKVQLIQSKFNDLYKMSGVLGYVSRGIVLLVIGYLLFHAALKSNPQAVQDSDGALSFLENRFGTFLMGLVAFGLLCYGVFMFVKAKYERIKT